MSIPGSAAPFLLATEAAPAAYEIERSLRFNSSDSGFLSRTPSVAGNRKTWTWAGWVKRSGLGDGHFWACDQGSGASNYAGIRFQSNAIRYFEIIGGGFALDLTTNAVFRDFSAWYHIVLAVDTTQATAANRVKLYANGTEQTFTGSSYPTQNTDLLVNTASYPHSISSIFANSRQAYFDGYLADIHFIDGQALTPSSFTETDATTGQLVPIAYSGTYGTNGFHLPFSDNSTAAALGTDTSGAGNDWDVYNISATTGGPTSVASASGALPIYNTTDTYGTVKGTGVRSDANASYLSLCLPLEGSNGSTTFTDESPTGRTSSTKTFAPSGNAQISTSQSYFYGSSCYLDGTGDYLTSSATGTDMTVGTGAFTLEFWGYFNSFSGSPIVLSAGTGGFSLGVNSSGQVIMYRNGPGGWGGTWTAQTLSTSTWYHIAAVTSSGSGGVWTVYINGVSQGTQSGWAGEGTTSPLYIGGYGNGVGTQLPNGYFSDIRIYKGIAKYTGNFNPPTATQIASVAAGNDSLVDTPTNYGTDTGAGGEVRGNYATLNPLLPTLTPTNGNLDTPNSAGQNYSTIAVSTGKWYVESTVGPITTSTACGLGVHFNPSADSGADYYNSGAYIGLLYSNFLARYEGVNSNVNFAVTASSGDILAIRLDLDSGTQTISYYLNNTLITSSNLPSGKTWFITTRQNNNQSLNFGQRPFAYTAPSGFKALCTTNLPDPVVAQPSTVMDVKLWTGNATARSITGFNFSPDFVWIKNRADSAAGDHRLFDTVRGATKELYSNLTNAEATETGGLTAFNSDGFSLGTINAVNGNADAIVGWCWDAGSSTVTNTDGSITSTVRANPSAGFSIVGYTGTGTSPVSVGHGLNVAPTFLIFKNRDDAVNWQVWTTAISSSGTVLEGINTTAAGTTPWTYISTTSSLIQFNSGNSAQTTNGKKFICYAFSPVAGYSSFGSFVGAGNTDVFVHLGFRPKLLMIKCSSFSDAYTSWFIADSERSSYNPAGGATTLWANKSINEGYRGDGTQTTNLAAINVDLLSNGFNAVGDNSTEITNTGQTFIYAAWAESPFKYSRAR